MEIINMIMSGFQVFESLFATEDGIEDRVIHTPLSFWQRILNPDENANLWTMTKAEVIQVACRKPAMYRMGDKLIVHPSLMPALLNSIDYNNRQIEQSNTFRWNNYTV